MLINDYAVSSDVHHRCERAVSAGTGVTWKMKLFFCSHPQKNSLSLSCQPHQLQRIRIKKSTAVPRTHSAAPHSVHITITALISWSFILARSRCRSSACTREREERVCKKIYIFKNYSNCIYFLRFIQCFSILLLSCAVIFICFHTKRAMRAWRKRMWTRWWREREAAGKLKVIGRVRSVRRKKI